MEKYFIIEKYSTGIIVIKDSITNDAVMYEGYTLEDAIKQHRKDHNLQHLKFTRIYL